MPLIPAGPVRRPSTRTAHAPAPAAVKAASDSDLTPGQWVLAWLVLATLGAGFAALLWTALTTPPR